MENSEFTEDIEAFDDDIEVGDELSAAEDLEDSDLEDESEEFSEDDSEEYEESDDSEDDSEDDDEADDDDFETVENDYETLDEAAQGPQAPVVSMDTLPITGEARVDDALGRLADLQGLPVHEHVAVFEDVQRRLHDTLADLSGQ